MSFPAKNNENLCKLFGRTTEFNIVIYVAAVLSIMISGGLWIYSITRSTQAEVNLWNQRAYISLIVGIISVAFMWAANMIYYELAFNKKCMAIERFIDQQIEKFRERISSRKIVEESTRVLSEEFKKQFFGPFLRSLLEKSISSK